MNLNPFDQLDLVVIGMTVVVFVTTYALLRRVFADKVVAVMDARRERCAAAEAACEEAQTLVCDAEEAASRITDQASRDGEALIQTEREGAVAEKARRLGEERRRTEQLLREGRAEILAEKEREIGALTGEAVECVTLACEKVVGGVDQDLVTSAVTRVVSRTVG